MIYCSVCHSRYKGTHMVYTVCPHCGTQWTNVNQAEYEAEIGKVSFLLMTS